MNRYIVSSQPNLGVSVTELAPAFQNNRIEIGVRVMYIKPWFTIDSQYTVNGIVVTFFNQQINLTRKDVCYLLCEIDVLATHLNPPLEIISFRVCGIFFVVRDMDWMLFIDALLSAVGQGGWNSGCCKPTTKWFDDFIRNQLLKTS
jgi:hypothetical protein